MITLVERLRSKWYTFEYNFGWPRYVDLFDGWVARMAMAVPVIGYLILFNDSVVAHLSFNQLAALDSTAFGLSASSRLKLIYLGLVLVGFANIVYRWKRPYVMKIGVSQFDYVNTGLRDFPVSAYIDLHDQIRHSGRGHYTTHGKYYDSEWEGFLTVAIGNKDVADGHWVDAKNKYESLLRSILMETFFRETTRTRRGWLSLCLLIAISGYALLGIPSADLFIKVMSVIITPLLRNEVAVPVVG